MHERHFKVDTPFAQVVDALHSMAGVHIAEDSELHCLATLDGGAGLIARPAYPDATDLIVAEPEGARAAAGFADRLALVLGREVPGTTPWETV